MRTFDDLPEWVPGMPERVVTVDAEAYLRWLETGEGTEPGSLGQALGAVCMWSLESSGESFGEWLAKNSGPIDWSKQKVKF